MHYVRKNGRRRTQPEQAQGRLYRLAARIMRSTDHLVVGMLGEWLALQHLKKNGYLILERNWRAKRGEIDIVAMKEGALVFIEVKCRTSRHYSPFDAIDDKKQARLKRMAEAYRRSNRARLLYMRIKHVRFDTIGVVLQGVRSPSRRRFFEINHKRGAFD